MRYFQHFFPKALSKLDLTVTCGPTVAFIAFPSRAHLTALVPSRNFGALGTLLTNHGLSYPTPANISYFWGFGSLSGLCLGLQLLSGVFLAMHYQVGAEQAFASVEHIMRDVPGGWFLRYLHANGASAFFGVVYLHMFRSLLYRSYGYGQQAL